MERLSSTGRGKRWNGRVHPDRKFSIFTRMISQNVTVGRAFVAIFTVFLLCFTSPAWADDAPSPAPTLAPVEPTPPEPSSETSLEPNLNSPGDFEPSPSSQEDVSPGSRSDSPSVDLQDKPLYRDPDRVLPDWNLSLRPMFAWIIYNKKNLRGGGVAATGSYRLHREWVVKLDADFVGMEQERSGRWMFGTVDAGINYEIDLFWLYPVLGAGFGTTIRHSPDGTEVLPGAHVLGQVIGKLDETWHLGVELRHHFLLADGFGSKVFFTFGLLAGATF